ncbi:SAM-dependent methyltransferase [Nonomuraea sediminis]|uniref:SAM-dependent methyltransferase n=1 Tax=Nonomuraea sediminis TaxID=2835864 RepID=UPI001BDD7189|nr:SAM-dependent methyltransferase [Nonomuraea sediminis]
MGGQERAPGGIDPTVPSVARMYDYYLGGKDNFAADRKAAEQIIGLAPNAREAARANRAFLIRAVTHLCEQGIRQFLDLGTGLPTQENVHQVARRLAPGSRVVYVDNDPIVLVHARALLEDSPDTIVIGADVRDPGAIVGHPEVREHLDWSRPVGVLLSGILHFVQSDEEAQAIVAGLRAPLVPGSYVVISHGHGGETPPEVVDKGLEVYRSTSTGFITPRTRDQVAAFLRGLDLVEPGLVPVQHWRSDDPIEAEIDPAEPGSYGVVGRIPG